MIWSGSTYEPALAAMREGLQRAQQRVDTVAASRARGIDVLDTQLNRAAPKANSEDAVRARSRSRRDLTGDMVELSRAAVEAKANTQVARVAGNVSAEVINLGRTIDVRA